MKCTSCKRSIAAGVEAQKMIVEYLQSDDTTKIFGYLMSDGPLSAATGRILRAWHHKHYHVERKREARGDALTGRVLAGGPTAYDMANDVITEQYSDRLDEVRAWATKIGKAVGDPHVQEALRGADGPYPHTHHHRLSNYQLIAHLAYAHGVLDQTLLNFQDVHDGLHAQAQQQAIAADRAADAEQDQHTRDWRDQFTAELPAKEHP